MDYWLILSQHKQIEFKEYIKAMSESPEDRSKRRFLEHLDSHQWTYQVSIFLNYYGDKEHSLDVFDSVRSRIARVYKEQPFLWRLAAKGGLPPSYFKDEEDIGLAKVTSPYLTLFTDTSIPKKEIKHIIDKMPGDFELRVKVTALSEDKINSYRRAVKKQKPHNLKAIYGDRKINRFGVLNGKHLKKA